MDGGAKGFQPVPTPAGLFARLVAAIEESERAKPGGWAWAAG